MSEIMVDEEVENILAEIRDRVRGRELPAASNSPPESEHAVPISLTPREALDATAKEVVARIDSYLTVTSRAWDRLPPLVSNRSGSIARIELWLKRQIKQITHWFTWEQVNFNAAVHHALREAVEALTTHQHALAAARSEAADLRAETEALRSEAAAQRLLLQEIQTAVKAHGDVSQADRAQLIAQLRAQHADGESQRAAQLNEMGARLAAISREMHERIEFLQDEQRVCFKQLSLEATEAAVLEDRARRQTDKVIEELRARADRKNSER